MSTLLQKANEVLNVKQTKIIPENIKKDVQIFDIVGTLEEGGAGDVKLFETIEEMQEDTSAQEGDLAIVYREEIQAIDDTSEFDSCIFPNTVVLSSAFSGSIGGRFRAVDSSSGWFDGNVYMSSSNFRFDGYGDTMIRVQYTSNDGITYTRTDGGEELQEFGTTIKWANEMGSFNSVIGNFMKIGGNYFDGLYEYGPFVRNMVAFNWGNIDTSTSPYVTITNTNVKVKIDILDKCCLAISKYLLR